MNTYKYDACSLVKLHEDIVENGGFKVSLNRDAAIDLKYLFLQRKYDATPLNPFKVFSLLFQLWISIVNFKSFMNIKLKYPLLMNIYKVCQWHDISECKEVVEGGSYIFLVEVTDNQSQCDQNH